MNAKTEFLELISGNEVKCATLTWDERYHALLPVNYTQEQLDSFLSKLDFEYDDGYGWQYLDGYVWFTDGTWADRREYDGSEWWEHHTPKEIPEFLKG